VRFPLQSAAAATVAGLEQCLSSLTDLMDLTSSSSSSSSSDNGSDSGSDSTTGASSRSSSTSDGDDDGQGTSDAGHAFSTGAALAAWQQAAQVAGLQQQAGGAGGGADPSTSSSSSDASSSLRELTTSGTSVSTATDAGSRRASEA
jgi:hypothetical protein